PEGALTAVDNVLAVEDNPGWKADGLLDRGRALFALKRIAEARKAADEAIALRPQGHTGAGMALRAKRDGLVGSLAGFRDALESEQGATAIEESVGFPTGVVFDGKDVVDGG